MIEIKSNLKSVADRQKWAARGASFMTKVKATKAVWLPPQPAEAGRKTAATATKGAKRTTRKTAGTTKKTAGTAKRTTSRAEKTGRSSASKKA